MDFHSFSCHFLVPRQTLFIVHPKDSKEKCIPILIFSQEYMYMLCWAISTICIFIAFFPIHILHNTLYKILGHTEELFGRGGGLLWGPKKYSKDKKLKRCILKSFFSFLNIRRREPERYPPPSQQYNTAPWFHRKLRRKIEKIVLCLLS